MKRAMFALWVAAAAMVAACGGPPPACVPNESRTCTTTEGRAGTQQCNFAGTSYAACVPINGPTPDCSGIECGPSRNVATLTCGVCSSGFRCESGVCVTTSARNCTARECGPDGAGGTCGSCASGRICSSAGRCVVVGCDPACTRGYTCVSGSCQLDPDGRWDLVAVSATVPESGPDGAWDPLGGLPDPYICYTVGTTAPSCSTFVTDRTMATWNFLVGTYSARTLMTTAQTYTIYDDDVGPDDPIASTQTTFTLGATEFSAGGWSSRGFASTVFRLTPSTR
jgi:hypothetical protein